MSAMPDSIKLLPTEGDQKSQVSMNSLDARLAFLELQKEVKNPFNSDEGNWSNYAPLDKQLDLYRPLCNKHGFSIHFDLKETALGDMFCCLLTYAADGSVFSSSMRLSPHQEITKYAGAITYARRYTLDMVLGVHGTENGGGDDRDPDQPIKKSSAETTTPIKNIQKTKESPSVQKPDSFQDTEDIGYAAPSQQENYKKMAEANYIITMGYLSKHAPKLYQLQTYVLEKTLIYYTKNSKGNSAELIKKIETHLNARKGIKPSAWEIND